MSKLESLVPPLELCKKIPAGAFADSALEWNTHGKKDGCGAELQIKCHDNRRYGTYYPAPTLAEILWEMASYPNRFRMVTVEVDNPEETTVVAEFQNFPFNGKPGGVLHEAKDENGATAALKLWLEMEAKNE